jgi:hypothetical protein
MIDIAEEETRKSRRGEDVQANDLALMRPTREAFRIAGKVPSAIIIHVS